MSGKNKKKFETCPNCNYRFAEVNNYCANCGQENHDLNMPFGHVVLEVLEGTFHFDTKIFRTLKLLLFKPGRLTAEFIQNKRAPYVPPIRLYVFVSFIFFLVLAADIPPLRKPVGDWLVRGQRWLSKLRRRFRRS